MNCRKVQQKLDAYLAGDLSPKGEEKLQAHLDSCPECREALVRAQRVESVLRETPAPPLPDGFADRVVARARQQKAAPEHGRVPQPVWGWLGGSLAWRAAVAAGLVVGLGLGAFLGHDMCTSAPGKGAAAREEVVDTFKLDYFAEGPEGSVAGGMIRMMDIAEKVE